MDGAAEVWIGIGLDLRRPRVGADASDLPIGEPSRDLEADPRLAAVESRVVLHPEAAPSRVEEHDVTGPDIGDALLGHRAPDIDHRDLLSALQHPALVAGHVQEDAPREEWFDLLDAELLEAGG